jgi:hypothetical protein
MAAEKIGLEGIGMVIVLSATLLVAFIVLRAVVAVMRYYGHAVAKGRGYIFGKGGLSATRAARDSDYHNIFVHQHSSERSFLILYHIFRYFSITIAILREMV